MIAIPFARTRVAYVGASMSGRTTALQRALQEGGNHDIVNDSDWHDFTWPTPTPQGVSAFVSSARARLWYTRAQPSSHPRVLEEIRRLREVDAVLFVWDVQAARLDHNREQLALLRDDLGDKRVPIVCLANKRDLPNQIATADLQAELAGIPYVDGVATNGTGCNEALAMLLGRART